ncbi:MAG: DUF3737 family protein [Blautia sp.]|jgi:hypothetical protein
MEIIENRTFDEERALYGREGILIKNCSFDGPADGESACKECRKVEAKQCLFNLRYPFWHNEKLKIQDSRMTEFCRAALWYSKQVEITDTKLHGIKALREGCDVVIENCDIISPEFGWSVNGMRMRNSHVQGEYFMMRSADLDVKEVQLQGKYSFQYIKNAAFENCVFDTKDAFWHSENVTVKNSVIKGEYLAWYSQGLTLINCKIMGTQPFCYCKNLTLIDCEMTDTDLCFEKSQVQAILTSSVDSIKNPHSGWIVAPQVKELIMDEGEAQCQVIVGRKAGEEFLQMTEENKKLAREYIAENIPQLQAAPAKATSLVRLDEGQMTGSFCEAAGFLREKTGIPLLYGKEYGREDAVWLDAAVPHAALEENLRCLKEGILDYEEFYVQRC